MLVLFYVYIKLVIADHTLLLKLIILFNHYVDVCICNLLATIVHIILILAYLQ